MAINTFEWSDNFNQFLHDQQSFWGDFIKRITDRIYDRLEKTKRLEKTQQLEKFAQKPMMRVIQRTGKFLLTLSNLICSCHVSMFM